jgi:hypothetical protein
MNRIYRLLYLQKITDTKIPLKEPGVNHSDTEGELKACLTLSGRTLADDKRSQEGQRN